MKFKLIILLLLLNQVLLVLSLLTSPFINNPRLKKAVYDFSQTNTPENYQHLLASRANVESQTAKERVVYLVANIINALVIYILVRSKRKGSPISGSGSA